MVLVPGKEIQAGNLNSEMYLTPSGFSELMLKETSGIKI